MIFLNQINIHLFFLMHFSKCVIITKLYFQSLRNTVYLIKKKLPKYKLHQINLNQNSTMLVQ